MAAIAQAISDAIAINLPPPSGENKSLVYRGGIATWGNWFSPPQTILTSDSLQDRGSYLINSTAGAFSLTLPAAPIVGESWVSVVDIGGALVQNNVSLLPGINNVMGLSGPFVLNTNYIPCFLIFTASKGWVFA